LILTDYDYVELPLPQGEGIPLKLSKLALQQGRQTRQGRKCLMRKASEPITLP